MIEEIHLFLNINLKCDNGLATIFVETFDNLLSKKSKPHGLWHSSDSRNCSTYFNEILLNSDVHFLLVIMYFINDLQA